MRYVTSGLSASDDFSTMVRGAIDSAKDAWNSSGTGAKFCEGDECEDYDNQKNGTVTIEVVANNQCLIGIACAPPGPYHPHNTDSDVIVEEPAYMGVNNVRRYWTDSLLKARQNLDHYYLPGVIVHELGHSLGIGHSSFLSSDVMRNNPRIAEILSSYDREAMTAALNVPHTHD